MPLKLSRRNKRRLSRRPVRKVRVKRSKRTLRYNGIVRQTRVCNPSLIGLTTDGTVLSRTGTGYLQFVGAAAAGAVSYGTMTYTASLGSLPGFTEYTTLYDKYRIDKIQVRFIPLATAATTGGAANPATTQAAVIFHWVIDYDDSNMPVPSEAGLQELREKQGYRSRNIYSGGGRALQITFKPHVTTPVYQSGLVTAYRDQPPQWLDTDYHDVPLYGLKFIAESVSAGAAQTFFFKVEAKYFLSFQGIQ